MNIHLRDNRPPNVARGVVWLYERTRGVRGNLKLENESECVWGTALRTSGGKVFNLLHFQGLTLEPNSYVKSKLLKRGKMNHDEVIQRH